jgi:hypothetical protein
MTVTTRMHHDFAAFACCYILQHERPYLAMPYRGQSKRTACCARTR